MGGMGGCIPRRRGFAPIGEFRYLLSGWLGHLPDKFYVTFFIALYKICHIYVTRGVYLQNEPKNL